MYAARPLDGFAIKAHIYPSTLILPSAHRTCVLDKSKNKYSTQSTALRTIFLLLLLKQFINTTKSLIKQSSFMVQHASTAAPQQH